MEQLDKVEWYIVFTEHDVDKHWVHKFLKGGFYHCYCFRQIGDQIYVGDPTIANIDTKIIQGISIEQYADSLNKQKTTKILKFKYPFDFNNRMFNLWNLAPTCVTAVKMFLGVTCKAQTPYQLYYALIRKGAIPFNY